jgi:hypothetical protein
MDATQPANQPSNNNNTTTTTTNLHLCPEVDDVEVVGEVRVGDRDRTLSREQPIVHQSSIVLAQDHVCLHDKDK